MKEPSFFFFIVVIVICLAMAVIGLYVLSNFRTLFRRQIRNEVLRQNVVVWLVLFCLFIAISPMNQSSLSMLIRMGVLHTLVTELISTTVNVVFVFNIVRLVAISDWVRRYSFATQRIIILLALIVTCVTFNVPMIYLGSEEVTTVSIKFSILWSIYIAGVTGFVYIMMTYIDAERSRKMQEKELELSKLSELKTKAELDALHSKVNPHFLYNALNSIADLSITDGKKARKMTVALADLFRYSINYSDNNYSTLKEELEMVQVYLLIEKIRFEDKLSYSVQVDEELNHYLVPRFLLQPVAENAVKHGLKATGQMTEISVEVKRHGTGMVIHIADTGPAFPEQLNPGYGVKSVYDKLELLFPNQFELRFTNEPRKQVSIYIHKLVKNEQTV